jgi:hypothetical protein
MNGAIPLLPLYDLMAWTGTSLSLPLNKASVLTCQSVRRVVPVITKGRGGKNNIMPGPVLGSPCNSLANIER